jgi:uncharacterized protein YqgC (DUF456 family)
MSNYLTITTVCLGCLIAVALTAVRLPGTWCLVAGAGLYGQLTDWQAVTLSTLLLLAVIAVIGEILELFTSAVVARKAGGSRRAAWGGLVGGMLGMFCLSFVLPIPIVGSMAGAIVGCFLGAAVAEFSVRNHLAHGTRVGFFAALGMAMGTAAKVGLALVMSVFVVAGTLRSTSGTQGDAAPPVSAPLSQPGSAP